MTGNFILKTDRLIIREFTLDDLDNLTTLFSDPDVTHFSMYGRYDKKKTKQFIEKSIESYKKHGFDRWAVILRENNRFIGSFGIHKVIVDGEDKIELSYRLAKAFWGKGLATETTKAIIVYGFKKLNLSEIVSGIEKENIRSIRVTEKNGMKFWKIGNFWDHNCIIYRITKQKETENNTNTK